MILEWIHKYRHRLVTVSLIVGFLSDIIIFHSISLTLSQVILAWHLLVVAVSLIALSIPLRNEGGWFALVKPWIPFVHQYSIGALLSAFLILYSGSASLVSSWPFFALVATVAIANETLRLEKYWLPFQTTLFFLSLLLFSALAVPVALNDIGADTFLISLAGAVAVFALFMRCALWVAPHAFKKNRISVRLGWTAALGAFVLLYFTNLIPPIPLSLTQSGVYHAVTRVGEEYRVVAEPRSWFDRFFSFEGEGVNLVPGNPLYVFTAVFAPADLNTDIAHRWQHFNDVTGIWETRQIVRFPIMGGREGGYRGYSRSNNPHPGQWRVLVETGRGQVIGRVSFVVERVSAPPATVELVF